MMRESDMPIMRLMDGHTLGDALISMAGKSGYHAVAVVHDQLAMCSMVRAIADTLREELASGAWQFASRHDHDGWVHDELSCGKSRLDIYTAEKYKPDRYDMILYGDGLRETVKLKHELEEEYDTEAMQAYISSQIKPSFYTQNSTANAVENT